MRGVISIPSNAPQRRRRHGDARNQICMPVHGRAHATYAAAARQPPQASVVSTKTRMSRPTVIMAQMRAIECRDAAMLRHAVAFALLPARFATPLSGDTTAKTLSPTPSALTPRLPATRCPTSFERAFTARRACAKCRAICARDAREHSARCAAFAYHAVTPRWRRDERCSLRR